MTQNTPNESISTTDHCCRANPEPMIVAEASAFDVPTAEPAQDRPIAHASRLWLWCSSRSSLWGIGPLLKFVIKNLREARPCESNALFCESRRRRLVRLSQSKWSAY